MVLFAGNAENSVKLYKFSFGEQFQLSTYILL